MMTLAEPHLAEPLRGWNPAELGVVSPEPAAECDLTPSVDLILRNLTSRGRVGTKAIVQGQTREQAYVELYGHPVAERSILMRHARIAAAHTPAQEIVSSPRLAKMGWTARPVILTRARPHAIKPPVSARGN